MPVNSGTYKFALLSRCLAHKAEEGEAMRNKLLNIKDVQYKSGEARCFSEQIGRLKIGASGRWHDKIISTDNQFQAAWGRPQEVGS